MYERTLIGWGYKFLKLLLLVLVIAGVVFLVKLIRSKLPEDTASHREPLALLETAYELRQAALKGQAEERVKTAANEVLAIQYQQELNNSLTRAEQLFFADRQSILRGDYEILKENWPEEVEAAGKEQEENASPALEP